MKIQFLVVIALILILASCTSQYSCGYDPEIFKTTASFSVNNVDLKVEPPEIVHFIKQFAVDNTYCLADESRYESENRFFTNIQIVKDNFGFYLYGTDKLIVKLDVKGGHYADNNDVNLFCSFIVSFINEKKVRYYDEVSTLCKPQVKN